MKQNFKAEMSSLPMIVKAIEDTLIKLKTEPKTRIRTMLAAEESATKLIEHSKPGSQLSLSVRRVMANLNVVMTVPGEKFEFIPDSPGLAMILTQINVPLEGISLIMGIYAIVDMFETVSNCLGDVSTTVAVARTEGLLNKEIYYSK